MPTTTVLRCACHLSREAAANLQRNNVCHNKIYNHHATPPFPLPAPLWPSSSNPHSAAFDRHDLIIRERCWHCCQQIAKRHKFQHKNSLKVTRGVGGERTGKWEVTSSSCTIQLWLKARHNSEQRAGAQRKLLPTAALNATQRAAPCIATNLQLSSGMIFYQSY